MKSYPFNDDWYFRKGLTSSSPAELVTLPHDAMLYETRSASASGRYNTGWYPGGVYRYTKVFDVSLDWQARAIVLVFEGVYQRSEVYVNGTLAGGRPSGYAEFHVKLNDFLRWGTKNEIEVIVHNEDQPNSRWYTGSGIYRPVHLMLSDSLWYISPWGVQATTISLAGGTATLRLTCTIHPAASGGDNLRLKVTVFGPNGEPIGEASTPEGELEGGVANMHISVDQAPLWSLQVRNICKVRTQMLSKDVLLDEAVDTIGIRLAKLDPKGGLCINGEPVKLRGCNIHHDNGVIGAHTLEAAEDRRIRILQESGYNAIRSAHNPISRALLRACDKYGMLVMDEFSDVWRYPKTKHDYAREFLEWWDRDLTAMVLKDFNYPSVIIYSVGNEIGYTGVASGIAQSQVMADRVRQLDPNRFTCNSVNGGANMGAKELKPGEQPVAQEDAVAKLNFFMGLFEFAMPWMARLSAVDTKTKGVFATVDIAGYNYMNGRYEQDIVAYPDRFIVATESSPASLASSWPIITKAPQLLGDFVWAGWDYIGEAGLAAPTYNMWRRLFHPYPALLAGEPIIDITGYRQPQSFHNEVIWGIRSKPYIAVRPLSHARDSAGKSMWRASDAIRSWSWEGYEGTKAVVEVYSAAPFVELRLNGEVVKRKPAGIKNGYRAEFKCPFRPGKLAAVDIGEDGRELQWDELLSATEGLVIQARLDSDRSLKGNGQDIAVVTIELTDNRGVVRPLADREVFVAVAGPGKLLGLGSAAPFTAESFTSASCTTYYGRALAVVRAGVGQGIVTMSVTASGCADVNMEIPVVS